MQIVKRKGIVLVICENPKHKQGKDNMARIVGVDIPRDKVALSCYIGIGMSTALEICKIAKIDTSKRVQEQVRSKLVLLEKLLVL